MTPTHPLPESCQHFDPPFNASQKRNLKLLGDLRANGEKSHEAQLELDAAQHGDPADPTSSQRLAEATMKRQLYKNNGVTLEKLQAEAHAESCKCCRDLLGGLRRFGEDSERQARKEFRSHIAAQVVNPPQEIEYALSLAGIRSREEAAAYCLHMETRSVEDELKGGRAPGEVWARLVALWETFANRNASTCSK